MISLMPERKTVALIFKILCEVGSLIDKELELIHIEYSI